MKVKTKVTPFLRWPGGKRWLSNDIAKLFKDFEIKRYVEPFLGGGAVFFNLLPEQAVLSDINPGLINVYQSIRDNPNLLIECLSKMPTDKDSYYQIRELFFKDSIERAAQFLYLNRLAFSGMYRVNLKGKFNVPYGGDRKVDILWENKLIQNASQVLKDKKIRNSDFEETLNETENGDFVYCDPTYTVSHNKNGFQRYNEKIFSWNDQIRLRDACFKAVLRGVTVIVSNAAHVSIEELYRPFQPIIIKRYTGISRKLNGRKHVEEYLYVMTLDKLHSL